MHEPLRRALFTENPMKHPIDLAAVLAVLLSTTGAAHAVFSTTQVPEPETAGLLIAGVLAVGAVRYLASRKRDRRRDD